MIVTFSSNKFEILAKKLKENLFQDDIFTQYIFVENKNIKNYLLKYFSESDDILVSFGLQFITINNLDGFILSKTKHLKEKKIINKFHLAILIEKKINEKLDIFFNLPDSEKKIYFPLIEYFPSELNLIKKQKRVTNLAHLLSIFFIDYSIFSNEIKKFEENEKWKISLYKEIIEENNFFEVINDLKKIDDFENFKKKHYHFFDISSLSRSYMDFLVKLPNAYFYYLSFSEMFIDDVVSNIERKALKKIWTKKNINKSSIVELDDYVLDRNDILANMGKGKREFSKLLNSYDQNIFFENFEENNRSNSNLNILKNDILKLINPKKGYKIKISDIDDSIIINAAASKLREVEILKENIFYLLEKNKDLKLSDIHVLTSDVDSYKKYFDLVFNNEGENLNYKIINLSLKNQSLLIQGLESLIKISKGDFKIDDVFSLLENESFYKKQNFSIEEIFILKKWIIKSNIKKGLYNDYDQSEFLYDTRSLNSWIAGLKRLIFGYATYISDDDSIVNFYDQTPINEIELSDIDLLNKFISLINNLKNDLEIIFKDASLTLKDFRIYLNKTIFNYFDMSISSIEEKACKAGLHFLENIRVIEDQINEKFSINTFFKHFFNFLENKKTSIKNNLIDAVTLSNFDIANIPSKVKFILDLSDEFLKNSDDLYLSLLEINEKISITDQKRNKFLLSIINSSENFIISYVAKENIFDRSILIDELLNYLDERLEIENDKISEKLTNVHPLLNFDKKYFSKKNNIFSFSKYKLAKLFYEKNIETVEKINFFKKSNIEDLLNFSKTISVEDLISYANNPLKYYFNKNLNVYLDQESKKNEIKLDFLQKHLIYKSHLNTSFDTLIYINEKKGNLPDGIFNKIEKENIYNECKKNENFFNLINIQKENLMKINISRLNDKIIKKENVIYSPPIKLNVENKEIEIIGEIDFISPKGLIVFSDDSLFSYIKNFPKILIFLLFQEFFEKKIIFTKNKKIIDLNFISPQKSLANFIFYFLNLKNYPSLFIKDYAQIILTKNYEEFEKTFFLEKNKKNMFEDAYQNWAMKNLKKEDLLNFYNEHTKLIKETFQEIIEKNENI
jgi:exonuclease V gamma subunit